MLVRLMMLIQKPDRRQADRLSVPTCPHCGVSDRFLSAVARDDAALHFRGDVCGYVRIVSKPAGQEYILARGPTRFGNGVRRVSPPPPNC
jgi:hypothetical protein